jgi:hypothetical protein
LANIQTTHYALRQAVLPTNLQASLTLYEIVTRAEMAGNSGKEEGLPLGKKNAGVQQ